MRLFTLLGIVCLLSTSSWANIMNGGFETGDLTGWTVGGTGANVQVLTHGEFSANGTGASATAPPEDNFYALLSNGPGDTGGSPLDTTTLMSGKYLVASGAFINFTIDFLTNELSTSNGGNADFYTVSVLSVGPPGNTVLATDTVDHAQNPITGIDCVATFLVAPDSTTVCAESGGAQSSGDIALSAYAGQVVAFQFLVSDAGDNSFDSALLVDAVQGQGLTPVAAVPEPASWLLFGSVLLIGLCHKCACLRRNARIEHQKCADL